ncbi:hypothetical protein Poli38472_005238 [Pythium oligandrum]|uniref:Fatty acid desaturase domain-containing protein n=1 Tax=Pythium oligandrum TaxID=41045 RepID=A0A8K1CG72_PYTOL|nr:hypothetical protein Poli38472_005238 [Pythium oligandrum]|eukprot:TMW62620.1 hypothetical protein Poli38472_005238 [Pythium oligandrum]
MAIPHPDHEEAHDARMLDDAMARESNNGVVRRRSSSKSSESAEEALRKAGFTRVEGAPEPLPIAMPSFSVKELRAAVPKHCFERSLTTSLYYLVKSIVICAVLFVVGAKFQASEYASSPLAQVVFWPTYWFLQGSHLTGLWILGHECGHHAFSPYKRLNDLVGTILHSGLLTPYYSWQISHRHHHQHVGNMDHDEVFIPMTRPEYESWTDAIEETLEDTPLYNLYRVVGMLVFGWMPGYLIFNATGPAKYQSSSRRSHFDPYSVLFTDKERHLVIWSDVGVGAAFSFLSCLTWTFSLRVMAQLFFIPFMLVNAYMVIITLLQHTDTFVPRFRDDGWTWLHGALCTVDRDFGWFLNDVLHHMPDTHVCHHIFAKIPFYHAEEATEALRPLLGRYYLRDSTSIPVAFWRCFTQCKFVEDDGTVVFCKKHLY